MGPVGVRARECLEFLMEWAALVANPPAVEGLSVFSPGLFFPVFIDRAGY